MIKFVITIILVNFLVFFIVGSIRCFKGLDLKKPSSWLYVVYGFASAFLMGFLRYDETGGYRFEVNLNGSFELGIAIAFLFSLMGDVLFRYSRMNKAYDELAEKSLQERNKSLAETLYDDRTDSKSANDK